MIRLLTLDDVSAAMLLVDMNVTVMGQALTPSKVAGIREFLEIYVQKDHFKLYGVFEEDKLVAFRMVEYNLYYNVQFIHLTVSKGKSGVVGELIRYTLQDAADMGFHQAWAIVENAWTKKWLKLIRNSQPKFMVAVEEVVPMGDRPFTEMYWKTLFYSKPKTVECAVLHYVLLPEYRGDLNV